MKIQSVQLSLAELQDALRDYCLQQGLEPIVVTIASYEKTITVELVPNGFVVADEFRHRA